MRRRSSASSPSTDTEHDAPRASSRIFLVAAAAAPLIGHAFGDRQAELVPIFLAVGAIAIIGNVSAFRRLLTAGRIAAARESAPESGPRMGDLVAHATQTAPATDVDSEARLSTTGGARGDPVIAHGEGDRALEEREPVGSSRGVAPRTLLDGRLLARHQIAAAVGTGADFATMVLLVELLRLPPPAAAVLSALVGGVVNFGLSRAWAFRARHGGTVESQALRYAIVSSCGALLNGALLALVLGVATPYPIARAAVAIAIRACLHVSAPHTLRLPCGGSVNRGVDSGAPSRVPFEKRLSGAAPYIAPFVLYTLVSLAAARAFASNSSPSSSSL